jgi:hypothetical protein
MSAAGTGRLDTDDRVFRSPLADVSMKMCHTLRAFEKSAWQSFAPAQEDGTTIRTM